MTSGAQPGAYRRRLVRSAAIGGAGTFGNGVVGIVSLALLIRALGAETFGVWALLQVFTFRRGLFVIADLDIGYAVTRHLAAAVAVEDDARASRLIGSALWLGAFFAIAAAAGLLIFGEWLIPGQFGIPVSLHSTIGAVVLCLALQVIAELLADTCGSCLTGLQRFDVARLGDFFSRTIVGTATVGTGLLTHSLIGVAIASVAASFVGTLVLFGLLLRQHRGSAWIHRTEAKELLAYGTSLLSLNLPGVVQNTVDRLVVGIALGAHFVTLIEIAAQVTAAISALQSTVTGVIAAAAAHVDARGGRAALDELLERATRYVLVVTYPLVLGVLMLTAPLLHVWVGRQNDAAVPVVAASMLFVLTHATILPASYILGGTNRVAEMAPSLIVGTVVNVLLTVILVLRIGPAGAPLATGLASIIYTVPWLRAALRGGSLSGAALVRRSFAPLIIPLCALAVVVAGVRALGLGDLTVLIVALIAGGVVYSALAARLVIGKQEIDELRRALIYR